MNISFDRIERWLWYIFLAVIPLQTRVILYHWGWAFNEWQSVALYGTDVLLLILFIFGLFRLDFSFEPVDIALAIFLGIAEISIFVSSNMALSAYTWVRLLEFAGLFWYVSRYALKVFPVIPSAWAFVGGAVFQSIIAIAQFIKQGSLGLLYFGESLLLPNLSGVASFYLETGRKVIRAYGTLPHPNILAAYLLVAMFVMYGIYLTQRSFSVRQHFFFAGSYAVLLFAFFFTFSRTSIAAWLLAIAISAVGLVTTKKFHEHRSQIIRLAVLTMTISASFAVMFWPEIASRGTIASDDQSVAARTYYNQTAVHAGPRINSIGIGVGNFVNWFISHDRSLPVYLYQPVHEVYLLVYAETGILGVGAFLAFLCLLMRRAMLALRQGGREQTLIVSVFCAFLFIAFFDHFFLTLQQGRILWWGVLGLIAAL